MSESRDILLIGVDGGGTGCRAAIARPGPSGPTTLAQAEGGRANAATDPDQAIRSVREAIARAARQAGLSEDRLAPAVAHLGLAGVISRDIADRIAQAMPFARVAVSDDRATATEGALGAEDGYLLAIGTGTIVAARRAGEIRHVGGWGFHVSDQGSGAWLGRRLLEEALLAHDGVRPHSALTRAALGRFGDDPARIAAFAVSAAPGDYGRFAPDVAAAADAGDPVGAALMREGAGRLERALRALGFADGDRLCLAGGVGPRYAPFLSPAAARGVAAPLGSALAGALRLAARAAAAQPQGARP